MRTTLNIDKDLLASVVEATGEKSKSKAVAAALSDYLMHKKNVAALKAIAGKVEIVDNLRELEALELEELERYSPNTEAAR